MYLTALGTKKAAVDSGVAQNPITDWEAYVAMLKKRLGLDNKLLNVLTEKAKKNQILIQGL